MFKALLFFVFCLLALSSAQEVVRLTIDDFETGFTAVTVTIPENPSFPIIESDTFTVDGSDTSSIIGGERTVIIEVDNGSQARQFQSIVDNGLWDFSTPVDDLSLGSATLQLDGKDGSANLDVTGLGGFDITEGGLGGSFIIFLRTDVDTDYTFDVYSPNGNVCTRVVSIPGQSSGTEDEEFRINFNSFNGNCDFTNVGAIEVNVFSDSKVDAIASFFGTSGDPDPDPSPSPSGVPPAPSDAPSPSAPPPGGFTWYTFDDDDNGRSPCGDEPPRRTYFVSDDNIIYYYFFGDYEYVESSSDATILGIGASLIVSLITLLI